MKFLDVDGVGRVSWIGLGTWQFGSREWGYGDDYAGGAARTSWRGPALWASRCSTPPRSTVSGGANALLGADRADVAVASKVFPVAPFPDVVKQRARASAQRLQLDRIPLYQVHQPNPVVPDSVIMT